ncbi:unnamed protein product [Nezara viridula]|uniref:Uncharacterized protein n=1 Tax=Nezara viridula TaxID=85310 RepID=A0A9P0HJR8_NEZVI|nr:unnamed protein product [Nezara viridula]
MKILIALNSSFTTRPPPGGMSYLHSLQNNLQELEDIPLGIRQRLWLMHDGAPAQFSNSVTDYLNATYGDRLVETDLSNGHHDLRI